MRFAFSNWKVVFYALYDIYEIFKLPFAMPAYPMGKIGNCPGPRAQGGPAHAEGVIENRRKRGKEKEKEKSKQKKRQIEKI